MTGATFSCPTCGANLELDTHERFIKCPSCHNTVVVPFDLLRGLEQNRSASQETSQLAIGSAAQPTSSKEMPFDDRVGVRQKVTDLLRQGKKMEAIKELRAAFPIGLAEAKRIADAVEVGQPVDWDSLKVQSEVITGSAQPEVVAKIIQNLQQGQRIEAIKFYRASYGVGLKEAKDAVDEMESAYVAQGGHVPVRKSSVASLICVLVLFFAILAVIFLVLVLLPLR